MRRKYLELEKVKRIQELQTKAITRYLSELHESKITVDEYLKKMRTIERTEVFFAMIFDTFEDFEEYMRKNYPEVAEGQIEHERLHYNHSMKHRLNDTKVGVYECFEPIPDKSGMVEMVVSGITLDYLGNNFSGWTAKEILEFERESCFLGCSEESVSESDKMISEIFKKMSKT